MQYAGNKKWDNAVGAGIAKIRQGSVGWLFDDESNTGWIRREGGKSSPRL